MANRQDIPVGEWFVGMDTPFVIDVGQDMTGWTTEFIVRETAPNGNIVVKLTGAAIVYSETPGSNIPNSRATATCPGTSTSAVAPGGYAYAFLRTDMGNQDPLVYGQAVLTAVAQP